MLSDFLGDTLSAIEECLGIKSSVRIMQGNNGCNWMKKSPHRRPLIVLKWISGIRQDKLKNNITCGWN